MLRRSSLLGVLLLSIALPAAADKPADKVTVPIEVLKSKHLAIMVKLNGKGPYRMIFDTGAPIVLVSTKAAKESGVLPKDAKAPPLALFGAMGQFPVNSLEVGTVKADKVPAVVMDHPAVTALSKSLGPLDGIIGYPFFARYTLTLDFQKEQLTLVPNGHQPADILDELLATLLKGKKPPPLVLSPPAQWGLVLRPKPADDEEAGITIEEVRPGSAAAAAGLTAGDRLLLIDGCWTESVLDCYRAVDGLKAGTEVPVVVRRDGKDVQRMVRPRAGL